MVENSREMSGTSRRVSEGYLIGSTHHITEQMDGSKSKLSLSITTIFLFTYIITTRLLVYNVRDENLSIKYTIRSRVWWAAFIMSSCNCIIIFCFQHAWARLIQTYNIQHWLVCADDNSFFQFESFEADSVCWYQRCGCAIVCEDRGPARRGRTDQKPLENINFYVQLFVNNPQYLVFIRTSILYILREQDT